MTSCLSAIPRSIETYVDQYDIPVPKGSLVGSPAAAWDVVYNIGAPSVLKAQILAGGRGKGKFDSDGKGGVRIINSPDEAFEAASKMLGYRLVTNQTPPGGLPVKQLYIYRAVDIAKEYYLAVTFDREKGTPVLLMSDEGGVNIESNVNQLQRFRFHFSTGITHEIIAYIEAQFGFSDAEIGAISHILHQLVRLFREKDAILLELNPLARTTEGSFICLDAKLNFDDSARFRQHDLFCLEEHPPEEKDEYEASQLGLSYVRLDGNIGVIVNGAGLAMATNDLVTLYGGKCANFLDIGGGATRETLSKAFSILQGDARIKALLINIYGGPPGGSNFQSWFAFKGQTAKRALIWEIQTSGFENVLLETDFEAAAQKVVKITGN